MKRRMGGPPPDAARIIRTWRERIGLTQEGLAQALDVDFSSVSRWENGHVQPSKLAWRAFEQFAAARGLLLHEDGGTGSPPVAPSPVN
jgi:transcriptional regulator with XRE-family HTH domain